MYIGIMEKAKTQEKVFSQKVGGAEGDRTPDLVRARDALSQLSHCPTGKIISSDM